MVENSLDIIYLKGYLDNQPVNISAFDRTRKFQLPTPIRPQIRSNFPDGRRLHRNSNNMLHVYHLNGEAIRKETQVPS